MSTQAEDSSSSGSDSPTALHRTILVFSEDLSQAPADLPDGGSGFDGIENKRHEIRIGLGPGVQGAQSLSNRPTVALGSDLVEPVDLAFRGFLANGQRLGFGRARL